MSADLLKRVADVMRRCDPEYCESHSVDQTTDDQWDDLLAEVEDACDEDRQSPIRVQGAADVH
jgi:hypothetical protein